jgi:hypothetical protein
VEILSALALTLGRLEQKKVLKSPWWIRNHKAFLYGFGAGIFNAHGDKKTPQVKNFDKSDHRLTSTSQTEWTKENSYQNVLYLNWQTSDIKRKL